MYEFKNGPIHSMIRVYLDDERHAKDYPDYQGWITVRPQWFKEFVTLNRDRIEAISFDHDLGKDQPSGYEFFCEFERDFHENGVLPPT